MAGMVYPDTSFLISLYGDDRYTAAAKSALQTFDQPLLMSDLGRLEYSNALLLLGYRKSLTPAQIKKQKASLLNDIALGFICCRVADSTAAIQRASHISETRVFKGGHRVIDILHIALALTLECSSFYSFDERQRVLAQQEGLLLNPITE